MTKSELLVIGAGIAIFTTAVGIVIATQVDPTLVLPIGAAGTTLSVMLSYELIKTAVIYVAGFCMSNHEDGAENAPLTDIEMGNSNRLTYSQLYSYALHRSTRNEGVHSIQDVRVRGRSTSPARPSSPLSITLDDLVSQIPELTQGIIGSNGDITTQKDKSPDTSDYQSAFDDIPDRPRTPSPRDSPRGGAISNKPNQILTIS